MTDVTYHDDQISQKCPSIADLIDDELGKARYFRRLDTPKEIDRARPQASDALFPGILGDVVQLCTKKSEAVAIAVAAHTLAWFSALVGPTRYYSIGDEQRRLNDFFLLVGPSASGKGTSEYGPKLIFKRVEEKLQEYFADAWQQGMTEGIAEYPQLDVHEGGLSSGEGLAAAKADSLKPMDKGDPPIEVPDKRFLIIESEFGNILNMAERQGNTLSHVLRNGFDGKTIRPLTKRDRVCCTDPYFVLVGNITPGELSGHRKGAVMTVNGMLNRMLILWTQSTQCHAFPAPMCENQVSLLAQRIAGHVIKARNGSFEIHWRKQDAQARPVIMTDDALQFWVTIYPSLVNMPDCELVQSLCRRHRLHVLIIAALMALINGRDAMSSQDLKAALGWSEYSRKSVVHAYNHFMEQQVSQYRREIAEGILRAVACHGGCCTMTIVYQWFNNRIRQDVLHEGLDFCINFIPPLINILPVQGQRGRPVNQLALTVEGRRFVASL